MASQPDDAPALTEVNLTAAARELLRLHDTNAKEYAGAMKLWKALTGCTTTPGAFTRAQTYDTTPPTTAYITPF